MTDAKPILVGRLAQARDAVTIRGDGWVHWKLVRGMPRATNAYWKERETPTKLPARGDTQRQGEKEKP